MWVFFFVAKLLRDIWQSFYRTRFSDSIEVVFADAIGRYTRRESARVRWREPRCDTGRHMCTRGHTFSSRPDEARH